MTTDISRNWPTLSAVEGDEAEDLRTRPARIEPLSTLPVFFELSGRRVVMAGGGAGAAWKAELLAAAGAWVALFCPADEIGEEMAALLAAGARPAAAAGSAAEAAVRAAAGGRAGRRAGSIVHFDRPWGVDSFAGAALAVGDCESTAEGRAFSCAARAARVPVNVVDKPHLCDFSFGTIVNRSPAIIAISTGGAAPILGQAIRRRIETLIPRPLAGWAALAARVRAEVMERLEPGMARRAFWERFSDRAFSGRAPEAEDEAGVARLVADLAASSLRQGAPGAGRQGGAATGPRAVPGTPGGRVTLVGAGPGEAELLTLKAVRALQAADVILFDDLVSDAILELARREAKRMLVGKRAARDSCRQEDINAMMIQFARGGKHVVRLKSGDVSVFGRAGEEIEALQAEGIPVAIVPGITAASALAASFGVSLTHRDRAAELRFVTGHSRKGGLPDDLDWKALANDHATTVFYMGGRMAPKIAERLVANGLSAATPVAVAANLSREDETRATGTLADLGAIVARIGVDRPILIGVGRVFEECGVVAEAPPIRIGATGAA